MFVILVKNHLGPRVIGPFETVARASGEGLNLFGPNVFGCPDKWIVLPLQAGR